MSYKSNKSYSLKLFLREFNFASSSWDNLPPNFPNLSKNNLSVEEKDLLDAIKLAWYANEGGKDLLLKKTKSILFVFICLIGLISLIRLIALNQGEITRPVQAATTQIDKVIQSTMSAILRK